MINGKNLNDKEGVENLMTNAVPTNQPIFTPRSPSFSLSLAQELLKQYGSPLYVYDVSALRAAIVRLTKAFPYPYTQFYFACVVNGNTALLNIFRECGWGLHANTPGDVYLGVKTGFTPKQIVYSGSNLNLEEMEQMIKWGVSTLNLDSLSQLETLCQIYRDIGSTSVPLRLGLRINLPQITGESRIGVQPSEMPDAVLIAKRVGLKVTGLHFYRGTGTGSTAAFTNSIAPVLDVAQTLPDWEYLDFGSGFGYPYRDGHAGFDLEEFGHELTRQLGSLRRRINLLVEPGRSAIAGCGTLLARVVSVKWQGEKQIIGVDTSIANIAVISVHGGHREIRALRECHGPTYLTDVCGNTTYSRDYLGRGCQLPALQLGDLIAILDVGAYGYAMSSHFTHRPRPAEVLVENGVHRLVRKRENFEDLINNQVIDM